MLHSVLPHTRPQLGLTLHAPRQPLSTPGSGGGGAGVVVNSHVCVVPGSSLEVFVSCIHVGRMRFGLCM
jgi:hypothetical protein